MVETWLSWAVAIWFTLIIVCLIIVAFMSIFGKKVKAPIEERELENGPRIISLIRQGNETLISVEHQGEILVMRFYTTWSTPVEAWAKQLGL